MKGSHLKIHYRRISFPLGSIITGFNCNFYLTLFGFSGGTVAVDFSVERRGVATTIGGERNGESQVGGEPAPGRSQSRNISVNHYRFFTGGISSLFLA